jgi:CubicO group peptidase (beta-lactamase class C family)
MKSILCIGMLLLLAACGGGSSGGGDKPDLARELESLRANYDLPALTAMLVAGDEIVEAAAVGQRAAGHAEAVTSKDKWHLGSITKSMTAVLAARLVEQGLVDWDTTVASVFPGLVGVMDPAYEDVRLDELLSHTSGLPENIMTPIWSTLRTSIDPLPLQREKWIEELLAVAPAVPRGTHLYSNAGYIVAGAMLETVTGVPWETLIQQEVFTPLGMTATGLGAPGSPGNPDQPWGHERQAGIWVAIEPGPLADNPAALGPAGTVHSTLADLARYLGAHLAGARGGTAYLTKASFDKLHTPAPGTDAALGWFVADRGWGGGKVLVHSGSNTYWYAVAWLAPQRNFAVFAATNAAGQNAIDATDRAVGLLIDHHI